MGKSKDSNRASEPRATWTEARSRSLIDELQYQCDNEHGRADNGFRPQAWNAVVRVLNDMGCAVDVGKVKNHYNNVSSSTSSQSVRSDTDRIILFSDLIHHSDLTQSLRSHSISPISLHHSDLIHLSPISSISLRSHSQQLNSQYNAVKKLRFETSGMGWDDEKGVVRVDDESVWESYCKTHQGARAFRTKPFKLYNALDQLNGHLPTAGERRIGTNSTKRSLKESRAGAELTEAELRADDGNGPSEARRGGSALDQVIETPDQTQLDPDHQPLDLTRSSPEASGSGTNGLEQIHPNLTSAANRAISIDLNLRKHPYLQDGLASKCISPKPQKKIKVSGNGSVSLATAMTTISEKSAAKAEAQVNRDAMKALREDTKSRLAVEAARIKNEKYPNSKSALSLFQEKGKEVFPDLTSRLVAAKILRGEDDAAFFISLGDEERWEWLKEEFNKKVTSEQSNSGFV
ncbi:hypothetical protein DFH28DRAFT_1133668 [Melampsora americana]|nr:hypothetical protein DFH28DRAFT_1133668 [Melampsora americana]